MICYPVGLALDDRPGSSVADALKEPKAEIGADMEDHGVVVDDLELLHRVTDLLGNIRHRARGLNEVRE